MLSDLIDWRRLSALVPTGGVCLVAWLVERWRGFSAGSVTAMRVGDPAALAISNGAPRTNSACRGWTTLRHGAHGSAAVGRRYAPP